MRPPQQEWSRVTAQAGRRALFQPLLAGDPVAPGLGDGPRQPCGSCGRQGRHMSEGRALPGGEAKPRRQASAGDGVERTGPPFSARVTADLVTQPVKTEAVTGPTPEPGAPGTAHPHSTDGETKDPAGRACASTGPQALLPGDPDPWPQDALTPCTSANASWWPLSTPPPIP